MDKKILSLSDLEIGKTGIVSFLKSCGNERRRMLDLGLVKDTKIEALYKSPCGDPTAYYIRGAVIALRSEDANKIIINEVD
ncbi:MAG: ferrous iron transport protein A [Bacilli bacterium]|nr:ferrous iron transport protein A [Bacilli bacterium]